MKVTSSLSSQKGSLQVKASAKRSVRNTVTGGSWTSMLKVKCRHDTLNRNNVARKLSSFQITGYQRGFVKRQSSSRLGRGRTWNCRKERTKQERWPMHDYLYRRYFCQEVRRIAQAAGVECISAQRSSTVRSVSISVKGHLPTQTNRPHKTRVFLKKKKTEHMESPAEVCKLKWLIGPNIQAIGNGGKSGILERKLGINSLEAETKKWNKTSVGPYKKSFNWDTTIKFITRTRLSLIKGKLHFKIISSDMIEFFP